MHIQWYPGHMYKANKEIRKTLSKVDLVIEILDARIPYSSENPLLAQLRGDKPCIKVLSKSDLADPVATATWQTYLEQQWGVRSLALTTKQPDRFCQLSELCRKMVPGRSEGIKPIHSLIVGIPNVGKSTLINILAGRVIAKTGNEPAVTKTQQRINLGNGIVLSDTPGVLWPNIENPHSGYRLAATGAIKDTAIDSDDVAYFTAEYLLQAYPERLMARFQLAALPESADELMEVIGRKRGCLRAGGFIERDKVARLLIGELRSGQLGRITLETPSMMEQELVEQEIVREQKAAKKAEREQRKKRRRKRK